jgi:hypothetical protein
MKSKQDVIHHSRFLAGSESTCGLKLNDGPGTVNLHSHHFIQKAVTCKNCLRKLQKDAKG